jgi:hypothetical protein
VAKSHRARATRATEGWSPALAIHVSSVRCGAVNFEEQRDVLIAGGEIIKATQFMGAEQTPPEGVQYK